MPKPGLKLARVLPFSPGGSLCSVPAAAPLSLPSTCGALGGKPLLEQGDHTWRLLLVGGRALQLHSGSKSASIDGPEECKVHLYPRHKELFPTQAPGVTRLLLFMVKAYAEQRKHSCQPEAQHNTCREGSGRERGGGCQACWVPPHLPKFTHTGIQGPASSLPILSKDDSLPYHRSHPEPTSETGKLRPGRGRGHPARKYLNIENLS